MEDLGAKLKKEANVLPERPPMHSTPPVRNIEAAVYTRLGPYERVGLETKGSYASKWECVEVVRDLSASPEFFV